MEPSSANGRAPCVVEAIPFSERQQLLELVVVVGHWSGVPFSIFGVGNYCDQGEHIDTMFLADARFCHRPHYFVGMAARSFRITRHTSHSLSRH